MRRPALVLADVGKGDFLLCQISSKQYDDLHVLPLNESDFLSGGIKRDSFIRGAPAEQLLKAKQLPMDAEPRRYTLPPTTVGSSSTAHGSGGGQTAQRT